MFHIQHVSKITVFSQTNKSTEKIQVVRSMKPVLMKFLENDIGVIKRVNEAALKGAKHKHHNTSNTLSALL